MNYENSEFNRGEGMHPKHYYGDLVRKLFVTGAIGSLLTILIDKQLIVFYLTFGVLMALIVVLLAGFTSPKNVWALYCDLVVASVTFVVFEYLAIARQLKVDTIFDTIFLAREAIAVIFVVAAYYAAKTVRGTISRI
jgi:uncharacterized membrane protein